MVQYKPHKFFSAYNVAVICVPVRSYLLIFYIYYEVVLKVCIMFSCNATSGDFYSLFLF